MFAGMSMFQMLKWGAIVAILLGALSLWFHYNSVVSERDLLAQNNVVLQDALEKEKAASKKLEALLDKAYDRFEGFQTTLQEMTDSQVEARKELEVLNGKFRDHNLEELAKKKPGLIENRLNNGTVDAFRMLEQASEVRDHRSSSESATSSDSTGPETGQSE